MASGLASPTAVVEPMLASAAPPGQKSEDLLDQLTNGWIFEPKLDGFRCLMHISDGTNVLRSRTGRDISQRFSATPLPELEGPLVIDGELIATDERGRPSFNLVQKANGRPGDPIATYVAFDLLYDADQGDIREQPWTARRPRLEALQASGLTVIPYSPSGRAIWDVVLSQDLEGAIAKRAQAKYRSGRSSDWLKLKRVRELSAIVTGFKEGSGARADSFGSLAVALMDDEGQLVPIGSVGSGFNEGDRRYLRTLPLPFVIEVRYQEWTGTALRMPIFKGVREDVPITDCTFRLQLPEARQGAS